LFNFLQHNKRDKELEEEIRAHLAIDAQLRVDAGENPAPARESARRDFGNVLQVKEATRTMWGFGAMERFLADLRYGLRLLGRNPGFTAAVVAILALGIGVNAAVFSLVDAVLLKSLPVRAPEELVWFKDPSFSYPTFQGVKERGNGIFSGLFAWDISTVNVEWNQDMQIAPALFVTGEFYSTLGVETVLGRPLNSRDEGLVAVISHDAWERRFQRDPAIIGKTIRVERMQATIVGVTPPGFYGVAPGLSPEITLPLTEQPKLKPQDADLASASRAWLHLMGRLKPGISRELANAGLRVFWPQVMESTIDPSLPPERRARFLGRETELMPGHAGYSAVRNRFTQPLLILGALVGFLLLAACASVANLLLVRASGRRREIAVRFALGASRGRVVRQLVTEGLLLSVLGAAAALLIGHWGGALLADLMATSQSPISVDLTFDWRTLAFTFGMALFTTLLFSIAPAIRVTGVNPGRALKEVSHTGGHGTRRWSLDSGLVIAQVGLAVILLAGAALFARSLQHLVSMDPGFEPDKLLVVAVDGVPGRYRDERLMAFHERIDERLRTIRGVESVSFSWVPPLSNEMGAWTESIAVDGVLQPSTSGVQTYFNVISPGYFATVGQQFLRGRDFGRLDREGAVRTCIITEATASAFFAGQDPIGHRISIGKATSRQNVQIVGVVRDAKYQRLQEAGRRIAYLPYGQSLDFANNYNLVAEVRGSIDTAALAEPVRLALANLDPELIVRTETLVNRLRESLVTERVVSIVSVFLGVAALLLAAVGLYGLVAYSVTRRTSEIGVRIALGATQKGIVWMIVHDSLLLVVSGLAAGLLAAFGLSRFAANLIHGISSTDPAALSLAAAFMLLFALLASLLPARRAARVDPAIALRQES